MATAASGVAQSAGTGTITGRVLNQATGQYLRDAVVTVADSDLSTFTEAGGVFRLNNVPAGQVRVKVTYADLDPAEAVIALEGGETVAHDFNLKSGAYDSGTVRLGEYVVAAEREGNAKALQEQRNSLAGRSIVASDAFGDVSEGNVAEFLKLLPGVTVDFVEADARAVSLGGLDPSYTLVTMDGAPIASAGSSNVVVGRTTEFEQLSISSLDAIEVNKTPTPDVAGSALAGVINLRSKGAFDRKGRFIRWQTSLSANARELSLGKSPGPGEKPARKIAPNASFEYSDVYLGGKLGVLAGINYSWSYTPQAFFTPSFAFNADQADNATEVPRITQFTFSDSPKTTERTNYNLRLDYKLTSDLSVWARIDYNKYEAENYGRDFNVMLGNQLNGPGQPEEAGVEYSLNSQTTTAGTTRFHASSAGFVKHGSTTTASTGLNYRKGAFTANASAQYSKSTNSYDDTQKGFFWSFNNTDLTGQRLTFTRRSPDDPGVSITTDATQDWRDVRTYPGNVTTGTSNNRRSKDQKWNARADFRYELADLRIPTTLKWGGAIDEMYRDIHRPRVGQAWTYHGPDGVPGGDDALSPQFAETEYRSYFPWGGNIQGLTNLNRWAIAREVAAHPERFAPPAEGKQLMDLLVQEWDIKEQIDALYIQPVFRVTKQFSIAPGFRWERTRGSAYASKDIGDPAAREKLTGSRTGAVDPASVEYVMARYGEVEPVTTNYDTSLKYLHLLYRWSDRLLFRASFNNSITRPPLNVLASSITFNETLDPPLISMPNPALRPESGKNYYFGTEYYFGRTAPGFVSVGITRRDLDSKIVSQEFLLEPGQAFNGETFEVPVRVRSFSNVNQARLVSAEFAYRQELKFLPGALRNLGVFANYTRYRYDNVNSFFRNEASPGLIVGGPYGHQVSGGASFRLRNFFVSWSMNWVPRTRIEVTPADGWARFLGDRMTHDLQLNYSLPRNITLFVTGRNITNEPAVQYRGNRQLNVLSRYSDIGGIWTLGVKGTF